METNSRGPVRPRRGWVAGLLAAINSLLGMIYVGRPLRGLFYLVVVDVCPFGIAFLLARSGGWPMGLSVGFVYLLRIIPVIDAYRLAQQANEAGFVERWFTTWKGIAAVAAVFVVAVLSFRAFVFEPFQNPSSSMLPTVHAGDQFFVSKRAYARTPPQRGDVIVFREPKTGVAYVKRVVGLPGEAVVYDAANERVAINGAPADIEPLGVYADDPKFDVVRETLDDRSHSLVLIRDARGAGGTYRVPAGYYFVLGDNRDNSLDSRFPNFGFVPSTSVVGKVGLIWWNDNEPNRAGIFPE